MAGQPLKQKLARELELRTRSTFEDEPEATHLDFVEDWQARGKTLNQLAGEILGQPDNGEFISRYLKRTFGAQESTDRLSRARARGGHAMAERALEIAEDTPADKDRIALANLQVKTLQWTAERWNREELGTNKGTSVTINAGALFLEALRQPPPPRPASATLDATVPGAQLLTAGPATDYEVEQRSTDPLGTAPAEQPPS